VPLLFLGTDSLRDFRRLDLRGSMSLGGDVLVVTKLDRLGALDA
jgi:hypothetical protein